MSGAEHPAACVQCSHSAHEGYCGTTCCPCWTELHAALTRIVEADDSRSGENGYSCGCCRGCVPD